MAQTPTQRTTGATRFKGPTIITLRGAGSLGHDPRTVGAGIDPGLSVQIPAVQTANAFQVEKPDGTVIAQIDASGNIALSGVLSAVEAVGMFPLTAAQITTLNTAPVVLLPAPASGKVLVANSMIFQFKYGSVQFTGGGAVNPVYHGATTNLIGGSVAAATIQAAANATIGIGPLTTPLALTANAGIDLYAATANFAAGNSTAIVWLWYTVLTLG
jgi:hypothetical protein